MQGHSQTVSRILRISRPLTGRISTLTAPPRVSRHGQNSPVNLARIAWLCVVLACLVTVLILVLQGYYGYAGVTLAVAIAAGINLV